MRSTSELIAGRALRALALLGLYVGSLGCHHGRGLHNEPSEPADSLQRQLSDIYFSTFDRVAAAAGLKPLKSLSGLPKRREVRLWIGGGLGYPQDLYRFVDDGGKVHGELIRYWHDSSLGDDSIPGTSFHDLMLYSQNGACVDFRRRSGVGVCRGNFVSSPDWRSALRRAEAADLWTLPDETALPSDGISVMDGWGIVVELRDGPSYRWYAYGNPDAHKRRPEAAKAVAIVRATESIDSLLRTPDVVREYRGITTGRYESEFVHCATGERWEFHDDLKALAERNKMSLPPGTDANYDVVVVAELSPEWLARQWGSKYRRVLQIQRLISVRVAGPNGCSS